MFQRILEEGLTEPYHDAWSELCEVLGFMRKPWPVPLAAHSIPLSHTHAPTGGASAHATTRDTPAARIACDEACTARMGGGGGEDARTPEPQTLCHLRYKRSTNSIPE